MQRWYGSLVRHPLTSLESLVIREEKYLVPPVEYMRNQNWAADRKSVLVLAKLAFFTSLKEVSGVEFVISEEFPNVAVKLVCT